MVVWQLTIYEFLYLLIHQKTQDMVYKSMGVSPTINVVVYALFVCSPKLKV